IQYIVEKALDTAMEKTKAQAGTVIVMNVKTGEILAMANRPAYDPNSFSQYSSETWKNRAISLVYEPGSTFKTVISAAALEENIVNKDTMFHDKGYYDVSGHTIKNWSGESYGDVTFLEVMKNSINTCFIQVGMKLGPEKLTDYAKKFGFGKATGIDLAGEEAGLLFDPAEMGGSDIATMSIGQSIAVTPIQMVTAFSAIANGGVLLKPYIVKEYHEFDADNENPTIQKFEPQSLGRVMGEKTSADLRYMLEKVVSEGGGSKAQVKGYRFAGKTGTAEKLRQSGYGYESGVYIASFAGFGPIDDIRYAAIVVIDSPQGVYYGGQIAAPVFSEIMSQIMYYEKMPKQN
ncbi:peptidoglycan glycosyltransferase, partial [Selenomonadales bacterium OttesenSCG-928-I06]|nr:peptidoglycan glycosyltransferase [Selenomonadales bacterium OttesenSCG-928-I06]